MHALIGASCLVKACHVCKSMVHACAQPLFIYLFFAIFTVKNNDKCSGTAQGLYSDKTHLSLKIIMIVKHLAPLSQLFLYCKVCIPPLLCGFTKKQQKKFTLQFFGPLITPPRAKDEKKGKLFPLGYKSHKQTSRRQNKACWHPDSTVLVKHTSVWSHRFRSCYDNNNKKDWRIKNY